MFQGARAVQIRTRFCLGDLYLGFFRCFAGSVSFRFNFTLRTVALMVMPSTFHVLYLLLYSITRWYTESFPFGDFHLDLCLILSGELYSGVHYWYCWCDTRSVGFSKFHSLPAYQPFSCRALPGPATKASRVSSSWNIIQYHSTSKGNQRFNGRVVSNQKRPAVFCFLPASTRYFLAFSFFHRAEKRGARQLIKKKAYHKKPILSSLALTP